MRRPIIAGNWKMNLLISEAESLTTGLIARLGEAVGVEVVLAPPYTALSTVRKLLNHAGIELAGQNIWCEPQGAYTGDISAAMLKDAGCRYVILGHSEPRKYHGEDDALINKKIRVARQHGLDVILCVGETLQQRERNETQDRIESQLRRGLEGLNADDMERIVIAYEPVWAIGTGKNATPEQAQETHRFIRDWLEHCFGKPTAETTRILYGGSVTPENSAGLLSQKDIDGALVGSASLKVDSFYAIINNAKQLLTG